MLVAQQIQPWLLIIPLVMILVMFCGILKFVHTSYRRARSGIALVRTGYGGTRVDFNGMVVLPMLQFMEYVDISLKTLSYERKGDKEIRCKDGTRVELIADLVVRVNRTAEDVEIAVNRFGSEKLSDAQALKDHFEPKFHEAIETVAAKVNFADNSDFHESFRQEVLRYLGADLNGFAIDDLAIHHLQQVK